MKWIGSSSLTPTLVAIHASHWSRTRLQREADMAMYKAKREHIEFVD